MSVSAHDGLFTSEEAWDSCHTLQYKTIRGSTLQDVLLTNTNTSGGCWVVQGVLILFFAISLLCHLHFVVDEEKSPFLYHLNKMFMYLACWGCNCINTTCGAMSSPNPSWSAKNKQTIDIINIGNKTVFPLVFFFCPFLSSSFFFSTITWRKGYRHKWKTDKRNKQNYFKSDDGSRCI